MKRRTGALRSVRFSVWTAILAAAALTGCNGEEFVTLNEIVGGIDKDTNFQAARSKADPRALEIAYRAGIVASGKNLAKIAELDTRG